MFVATKPYRNMIRLKVPNSTSDCTLIFLTHPSCHCPPHGKSFDADPILPLNPPPPDAHCLRCPKRRCCSGAREVHGPELGLWWYVGPPGKARRGRGAGCWGRSWEVLGTQSVSGDCGTGCHFHSSGLQEHSKTSQVGEGC